MELELKHLAPYLPYGLKWIFEGDDVEYDIVGLDITDKGIHLISCNKYRDYITVSIDSGKPILRPLSDLAKEIEHKGKKFILAQVLWSVSASDEDDFYTYGTIPDYWSMNIRELRSGYRNMDYGDIEEMLKYHFDVFGLIEKGLAIDINTVY